MHAIADDLPIGHPVLNERGVSGDGEIHDPPKKINTMQNTTQHRRGQQKPNAPPVVVGGRRLAVDGVRVLGLVVVGVVVGVVGVAVVVGGGGCFGSMPALCLCVGLGRTLRGPARTACWPARRSWNRA